MKNAINVLDEMIAEIETESNESLVNWKYDSINLHRYNLADQARLLRIAKMKIQIKNLEV